MASAGDSASDKDRKRVLVVMKIDNAVAKPEENGFESQIFRILARLSIQNRKEDFSLSRLSLRA